MSRRVVVVILVIVLVVAILVVLYRVTHPHRKAAPLHRVTLPVAPSPVDAGTVLFDSNRSGNFEIMRMDANGANQRALTNDPRYDSWWPKRSPDGKTILFYRTPVGDHDTNFRATSLWAMGADGGGQVELLPSGAYGWDMQGHAEWSPDGQHLVMFAGSRFSPQVYVTDARGRSPRKVTDRAGVNLDPSWSPDGSTIVFVGCPSRICLPYKQEVYTISVGGGHATRVTSDGIRDQDPYYSSDGSRLAWLSQTSKRGPAGEWNIRLIDLRRRPPTSWPVKDEDVTRVTDDEWITSKPDWSPAGDRLYFHRLDESTNRRFEIFSARPDGSGRVRLTDPKDGINEYPDA